MRGQTPLRPIASILSMDTQRTIFILLSHLAQLQACRCPIWHSFLCVRPQTQHSPASLRPFASTQSDLCPIWDRLLVIEVRGSLIHYGRVDCCQPSMLAERGPKPVRLTFWEPIDMQKLIIRGGKRLSGTVRASGAKNAALPVLAATILTEGTSRLYNVPAVVDITTMCKILAHLGVEVNALEEGRALEINTHQTLNLEAPYDLVRTMRASVIVLGPMLAKYGRARVSMPGGCAIGERPIDMHLAGLEKMGARIKIDHGYVDASADRLVGAEVCLDYPTVGGTENIVCAATLAKGVTIIENAAKEPEIVDLADFLNKAGARISGAGTHRIEVEGVDSLIGVDHTVIPDRIEVGTFAIAGAITGGNVTIAESNPDHLTPLLEKLVDAGCEILVASDSITVRGNEKRQPVNIRTRPYPGYPTDLQAQWLALMTLADGASVVRETVFERRFMHVQELRRMGADIRIEGDTAIVTGVERLQGAQVMATDIRASASLILAGLAAENTTEVNRIYHLDRGYERIEEKLRSLGADIVRAPA